MTVKKYVIIYIIQIFFLCINLLSYKFQVFAFSNEYLDTLKERYKNIERKIENTTYTKDKLEKELIKLREIFDEYISENYIPNFNSQLILFLAEYPNNYDKISKEVYTNYVLQPLIDILKDRFGIT